MAYEAGPFGFWLHDRLMEDGIEVIVAPPSPISIESGNKVKTDKRVRTYLVESSWILIQEDPVMRSKYNRLKNKKGVKGAIIVIARNLLIHIRRCFWDGNLCFTTAVCDRDHRGNSPISSSTTDPATRRHFFFCKIECFELPIDFLFDWHGFSYRGAQALIRGKNKMVIEVRPHNIKRICAWCNVVMGDGIAPATDGICHKCARELMDDYERSTQSHSTNKNRPSPHPPLS